MKKDRKRDLREDRAAIARVADASRKINIFTPRRAFAFDLIMQCANIVPAPRAHGYIPRTLARTHPQRTPNFKGREGKAARGSGGRVLIYPTESGALFA